MTVVVKRTRTLSWAGVLMREASAHAWLIWQNKGPDLVNILFAFAAANEWPTKPEQGQKSELVLSHPASLFLGTSLQVDHGEIVEAQQDPAD